MDLDDDDSMSPIRIPRKRKSVLGRKSLGNYNSPRSCAELSPIVPSNDDDAERRERHREHFHEQNVNSPATPAADRSQTLQPVSALAGLTTDQVTEHYANCMKLSAENKISTKNAFGLHLIDYMSDLLKKTDGEKTNFQMASCTLDASTKIYAYRVDCVHADVYKMASSLGLADNAKRTVEDDVEDGEGTEEGGRTVKKKRKTKRSTTVETNVRLLNVQKLELGFEGDALYSKMSRAFEEGGANGLLFNICTKNDSSELILDASELYERPIEPRKITQLSLPNDALGPINRIKSNPMIEICPSLAGFSFLDKDSFMDFEDIEVPMAANHAFDMNEEPEPLCDDAGADDPIYNDCDDDDGGVAGQSEFDNISFPQSSFAVRNCAAQNDPSISAITLESARDLTLLLSEEPSEYSYFSKKVSTAWAGPQHWHIKPFFRAQSSVIQRTQPHKKSKTFKLLFDDDSGFGDAFSIGKNNKLNKKTVLLWDIEKTTFPEDLHYDPAKLCTLSHVYSALNFTTKAKEQNIEVGNEVGEYNYENENDRENFCPDIPDTRDDDDNIDTNIFSASMHPDDDDDDDCCSPGRGASQDDGAGNDDGLQEFTGSNLVAQPYKVDKISINYARQATKIDARKLKEAMWGILTDKNANKENEGRSLPSDKEKMNDTMEFAELFAELPNRITPTMAESLSVPTAFVCFLHLANERSLDLTGKDDLTDFTIGQG